MTVLTIEIQLALLENENNNNNATMNQKLEQEYYYLNNPRISPRTNKQNRVIKVGYTRRTTRRRDKAPNKKGRIFMKKRQREVFESYFLCNNNNSK